MLRHIFLAVSLLLYIPTFAKTRLAVSTLKDEAGSSKCRVNIRGNKLGTGMRTQLVTELMKYKNKFEVMERENLNTVYSEEHNLVNSDDSAAPKRNKFKAAHYSITGSITSFELCADATGGKVDLGGFLSKRGSLKGLKVGAQTANAKVVLDLRIVDVETGEVIHSVSAEGNAKSTNFDLDTNIDGIGLDSNKFESTPIGEATREALNKAAADLAGVIPNKQDEVVTTAENTATTKAAPTQANNNSRTPSSTPSAVEKAPEAKPQYICNYEEFETFKPCKIVELSKQKTRGSVLFTDDGSEKLLNTNEIFFATPLSQQPAIATKVGVPYQTLFPSSTHKTIIACKVTDQLSTQVVVTCPDVSGSGVSLKRRYSDFKIHPHQLFDLTKVYAKQAERVPSSKGNK